MNSSGRNLWDVSAKFITYSGFYPDGSGGEKKCVSNQYGINQIEFKYCPLASADLINNLQSRMDYYVASYGFTMFHGYNWCVPRGTYDQNGTVDFVWPDKHPVKTSDKWASKKPIMADMIMKSMNGEADLSDDVMASKDFSVISSGTHWLYATHVNKGKVMDTNLVYADTHVEVHMPNQIKNRYGYSAFNMY